MVWPAAMITEGVTVAFVGSLLVRLMVTPPDGAAADNVTGILMLWPGATATPGARPMLPGELTTILVVPLAKPVEEAVIVPVPSVTPVMLNEAVLLPAAMFTVGGLKDTRPLGATERATLTPLAGAGELSVTVPLTE